MARLGAAKLEQAAHAIPNDVAEHNPATAHLFIINPLSGARMDNLFATHPATENRIAALMELAREMGQRCLQPRQRAGARRAARPVGRRPRAARPVGLIASPKLLGTAAAASTFP